MYINTNMNTKLYSEIEFENDRRYSRYAWVNKKISSVIVPFCSAECIQSYLKLYTTAVPRPDSRTEARQTPTPWTERGKKEPAYNLAGGTETEAFSCGVQERGGGQGVPRRCRVQAGRRGLTQP